MIPELGQALLIFAFLVSMWQATVIYFGKVRLRDDTAKHRVLRFAMTGQFLAVAAAFFLLIFAYIVSDFSVANVAENSHTAKPLLFKIAGAWGNHEGSMVLWIFVLAVYGFALARLRWAPEFLPLKNRVLALHGLLQAPLVAYIFFTSNPFLRMFPRPWQGADLNPLLQDVGLALHPPFLYLGYVGFGMAFLIACAAMLHPVEGKKLGALIKPWVVVPWSLETFGIGLGSWWAYRELGWGGWWFWDPVENASLMPWIAATALVHSNAVLVRRGLLKRWVLLLAILTFIFSLLGTFLVRSGIITSVHSFASDPTRGIFILGLLVAIGGGALLLFARQQAEEESERVRFTLISRESLVLVQNILMLSMLATVCLGTLYPLLLQVTGGNSITVGAPYYIQTLTPLLVPMMLLMGAAFLVRWQDDSFKRLAKALMPVLLLALAITLIVQQAFMLQGMLMMLGLALAAWAAAGLFFGLKRELKAGNFAIRKAGGYISHLGAAILCIAITANLLLKEEYNVQLELRKPTRAGNYTLTLETLNIRRNNNHAAMTAMVRVKHDNASEWELFPELRIYHARKEQTAESDIAVTPGKDVYLVLRKHDFSEMRRSEGLPISFSFTLYDNPGMVWIWFGIILAGVGGLFSITRSRHGRHSV